MSVLIKGMEMPKRCCKCNLKYWDGEEEVCPFVGWIASIGRHDSCPLIPVLPHGRLLKVLKTERECVSRDCNRDCGKCDLSLERGEILAAYDTLIAILDPPAEEGDT